MPTYQYACPDCGADFERVQKFTDKPIKKCPTCGKSKVHRVVGRIAVSFKGSGFYLNDSKSSSSTSKEAAKPKDDKDKSAETKTETPAADSGSTETAKAAEPAAGASSTDTAAAAESKPAAKPDGKKKAKKD